MKVYEFLYCPCIHESGWVTVSLHITKEGALKAMKKHTSEKRKEFNKMFKGKPEYSDMKFGEHESWCVKEQEILNIYIKVSKL